MGYTQTMPSRRNLLQKIRRNATKNYKNSIVLLNCTRPTLTLTSSELPNRTIDQSQLPVNHHNLFQRQSYNPSPILINQVESEPEPINIRKELQSWAVNHHLTQCAVTNLLKILKKLDNHESWI